MAKSSRSSARSRTVPPKAPASRAESWLTAAERKLLDGTLGRSLAQASQKQLQATMAKARTLRDKWRDLFNRQMKSSKRTARRGQEVNSRSLDKADLFAAAVRRVESRLAEMVAGVTDAIDGRRSAARSPKPKAKSARTAGHRATRSSVRKALATLTAATTKPARPAKAAKAAEPKPAPSRPAATQGGEATASPAGAVVKRQGKPVTKPVASKKARQAGKRKVTAAAGGAVGYDSTKQRSAKASATAARIKFDGLSTRRRGHTLVAGKRRQARRDGR